MQVIKIRRTTWLERNDWMVPVVLYIAVNAIIIGVMS